MNLTLTRRILIAIGLIAAVVAGWNIANENPLPVAVIGVALILWMSGHVLNIPTDALIAGIVLAGYLVGNRGFAQLQVPRVPMLPGEFALGLGLMLSLWRSVQGRATLLHRDALDGFVFGWIALGVIRIPVDLRAHGFVALRDFAFVYYALFYFVARSWNSVPAARRWVLGCVMAGLTLAGPVFCLFLAYPDWFVTTLAIGGIPIVFVKNDVAGGFLAGGALWFVHRYVCSRRVGWLAAAAAALVGVAVGNNRASIVALGCGIAWLVVLRAWRMVRVVVALLAVGLCGLLIQGVVSPRPVTTLPIYRLYESLASIADLQGNRVYRSTDLDDKPDNNQFRLVWWRAVATETWADGRWFGLGFGHDLAGEFLRVYYADNNDEFNVRSPHNYLLSIFGRMGLVGIAGFGAIAVVMARKTWVARDTVDKRDSPLPLWLVSWTILASACLGVVLEGPMGAIVFWTLLGLANASPAERESDAPEVAALPTADAYASATDSIP